MGREIRKAMEEQYLAIDDTIVVSPVLLTGLDTTTSREILKAPKNSAHSIFIMGVLITNPPSAALSLWLQADTGGTPVTITPSFYVLGYSTFYFKFPHPLKVAAGKNVGVKSTSTSTTIMAWIFARV